MTIYDKDTRYLFNLAQQIVFPASKEDIELIARRHGYNEFATTFLNSFSYGELFNNRAYFLKQCKALRPQQQSQELVKVPSSVKF